MLANFKLALAVRGIKQVELALRIGIDPALLSRIVNGRRNADPVLRTRLAEALQVDEAWLFSTIARIPAPTSHAETGPVSVSRATREK